jgi:hypothetical protein
MELRAAIAAAAAKDIASKARGMHPHQNRFVFGPGTFGQDQVVLVVTLVFPNRLQIIYFFSIIINKISSIATIKDTASRVIAFLSIIRFL